MIGAVTAIGDFMVMLLKAAAAVVFGVAGWILLGIVITGCIILLVRYLLDRANDRW